MVICSLVWDYTIGVVFYWPICGFTMFWPTPGTPEKTLLEKRGISYLFENVSPSLKATFDGGTKLGQFMPRNWISFVVKCRRKRQGTEAGFGRQRLVASKRVFFKRKMDLKKKMGKIYLPSLVSPRYHADFIWRPFWYQKSFKVSWTE